MFSFLSQYALITQILDLIHTIIIISTPLPSLFEKHKSYHLSHAGLEPFSIQFGSACLVHILVSQSHKTTGNNQKIQGMKHENCMNENSSLI